VGSRFGCWMCARFALFPWLLFKGSFAQSARLTKAIHHQYLAPFAAVGSRKGTGVFPRAIVGEYQWLSGLWERRDRIDDLPALLIWGMADEAFAPLLPQWREAFPGAGVVMFDDIGHNVAEEAGDKIVQPVAHFLRTLPQ